MRVLVVSDIHSHFANFEEILKSVDFDVLFISGDLTDFSVKDVFKVDEIISKYASECYAVHGNCDYETILNLDLDSITFIHAKSVKVDELTVHGLGGSGITPFNTPSEYPESEIERILANFKLSEVNVLLSHCPPKGILDKTRSGVHAGCAAIRKFAEKFDVIFCGHIHEAHGVVKGDVFAANPGPAAWRRYAVFDTNTFEVELHRL